MKLMEEHPQNATVRFAGEELLRYIALAQMPPALAEELRTCPVTLSWDDQAVDEAFRIRADTQGVDIWGSSPRAVLIGVYALLHRLGYRFLAPGERNERIPALTAASFPVQLSSKAAFRHRGVCIEGADSVENILDFIDWLPKAGFNSFFVQHDNANAFMKRWYTHVCNRGVWEEPLTAEDYARFNEQITQAMTRRGLLVHRAGHGWTSKVMGTREVCERTDMRPVCPPEYLALIGGERGFIGGIPSNTNLCYANESVLEALAREVVTYATAHPETACLHVWLADDCNNICECEACRRTTPSDQYVRLLNRIDAALCAVESDVKIALLLYQELLWPPVQARLDHPERFVLVFAPISRTFEKSYQDMGAPAEVPPYVRNHITLPHSLEENTAYLRAWQGKAAVDSFVYDYPLGRAHYGDLGYVHIARLIARDIKTLRTLGLNGYMSCQELRAAFPNGLPDYMMGRLLWDPSASPEEVIKEYFQAAYGALAGKVFDYLSQLSALSSCDYFNGIGPRVRRELSPRYAEAARLAEGFAPALAQWQPEGPVETRSKEVLAYQVRYAALLAGALAAKTCGERERAETLWTVFMGLVRAQEPAFQAELDVYRVLEVGSKYTGFPLDIE